MTTTELWFEDSSDEDERLVELARSRKRLRDASNIWEMDTIVFITNFRLSKEAFVDLLSTTDELLQQCAHGKSIPSMLKLSTVLRFCAQGSYQLSIGNENMLGLAQPTVSVLLSEALEVLENNYTAAELQEAKLYFFNKSRIPGIIGYFIEESVIKAIALDTYETGQLNSSMVDDVFFILRKSIRRSISSQSVNGTCAVINNAATCLESDFVNALRAPLKQGYPSGYIDLAQAYNAIQSSLQQGRIQSNDNEKARINFLVHLNNADVATEYIQTLCQTIEQEIKTGFPSITNSENQLVESCLAELKTVRDTLKACVDFGMQQLRSSAIKPRLNPWVDQFLKYNHHLSEEELASYEASETFAQFLIIQVDDLLNTFKPMLTARNSDALISIVATELTSRLERVIKKSTFNRLGGLVLDQEVRVLGAYLASTTSWSVRDKMARLNQIATILNLDKASEVNDYWNSENISELSTWRLSPNEVKTILTLRTDFRMEDIKQIRF